MKKTILFINGHLDAGGCERSLVDVLKNMDYDKYDVDLLLLEHTGDYLNEVPKNVRVFLYSLDNAFGRLDECLIRAIKKRDYFSFWFRVNYFLWKKIGPYFAEKMKKLFSDLREDYDIIIAYRPGICTDLAAFIFCGEKKISWWHHGTMNITGKSKESLNKAYQKMDKVVSVSKSCKKMLEKNFPDIKEKIIVIPNMIIPDELTQKAKLYRTQEFQDANLKIVTVGRMSYEKNMILCPEIAVQLKNSGIDFRWILIGDGEEENHIREKIHKYGLQKNLVMIGRKNNPYPYIANADIMVHPSLVESQGIVILESMALSTLVIAVESSGPSEFIKSGDNGYLVKPNVCEIVELIKSIYNNIQFVKFDTSNGLKTVYEFTPEYVMKKIEMLIGEN